MALENAFIGVEKRWKITPIHIHKDIKQKKDIHSGKRILMRWQKRLC